MSESEIFIPVKFSSSAFGCGKTPSESSWYFWAHISKPEPPVCSLICSCKSALPQMWLCLVYLGSQWPGNTLWPDWSYFCLLVGHNREVSCHAGWEGHPNSSWASANPPEGIITTFKSAKQMCHEINQDPGLLFDAIAAGFSTLAQIQTSSPGEHQVQVCNKSTVQSCRPVSHVGTGPDITPGFLSALHAGKREWETKRKGDLAAGIGVARRRH